MRQLVLVALMTLLATSVEGQSLRGSPASVARMYQEAKREDLDFLSSSTEIMRYVRLGLLVRLDRRGYSLRGVSYPYVRPATKLFIERLSSQMAAVCGEHLVVTSATRPTSERPVNGSPRSVHPTGMALDLRPPSGQCRQWLESVLLDLEEAGVLEATREKYPAHYHVAVFPAKYAPYVEAMLGRVAVHVVRQGDTLSELAEQYGSSVGKIKVANGLSTDRIRVGQKLSIPR